MGTTAGERKDRTRRGGGDNAEHHLEQHDESDRALIDAVRDGSDAAFAVLYTRYRAFAVKHVERYLSRDNRSIAEDIVEVAFTAVYRALRNGFGPTGPFNTYLVVVLRREANRQAQRRNREPLVDPAGAAGADDDAMAALAPDPTAVSATGPDVVDLRAGGPVDTGLLIGGAYAALGDRFRQVLWLNEVEGRAPAEIGRMLGVSSNTAAALCYRARTALRRCYFDAYRATAAPLCAAITPGLAEYTAAGRPTEGFEAVRAHLEGCASCRSAAKGSALAAGALASAAPIGLLSSGAWLDQRPEPTPAGGTGSRRGRRRAAEAVAVAVTAAVLAAIAAWPTAAPVHDAEAAGPKGRPGAPATAATTRPESTTTVRGADTPPPVPASPVTAPDPAEGPPGRPAAGPAAAPTASKPEVPVPTSGPPSTGGTDLVLGTVSISVSGDTDGTGPRSATAAAGTPIRLIDSRGATAADGTTGSDGRFETAAAPGRYRVAATVPVGMTQPGDDPGDPAARREQTIAVVEVDAGETAAATVALEPSRRLTVTGGPGSPAPGGARWVLTAGVTGAPVTDAVIDVSARRALDIEVTSAGRELACTPTGGGAWTCPVGTLDLTESFTLYASTRRTETVTASVTLRARTSAAQPGTLACDAVAAAG